jgi:ferric-dicitrate binding protein FerR (iron transport regulator)
MAEDPIATDSGDEGIERALRTVLHPPVSAVALAQLRSLAEFEWRRAAAERRRRQAWRRIGLGAAAAGIFAISGWLLSPQLAAPGTIGVIQSCTSGDLLIEHRLAGSSLLAVGAELRTNERVHAGGTAVVTISGGGQLLLKEGTTIVTSSPHEIELIQGTVYVDVDPMHAHGTIGIRTAFGLVEHVGTQFEVTHAAAEQKVRVREGTAQLTGLANATAQAGEEITLDAKGNVGRRALVPYDATWAWVDDLPTSYNVEGQSLLQFLRWVARQTGRQLDFSDERARQLAEQTTLHGSIRDVSAVVALREMLATTSLSAALSDGRIRVSVVPSKPAHTPPLRSP